MLAIGYAFAHEIFVPWTWFDPDRRVEPTTGAEDEACPRGGRERSGF